MNNDDIYKAEKYKNAKVNAIPAATGINQDDQNELEILVSCR
jgi:hypothetical protein